jgi:hypothetical protein
MTDALHEGRKVGIDDLGYIFINISGHIWAEDLNGWFHPDKDELIGELFRRHEECVIFPEEGP